MKYREMTLDGSYRPFVEAETIYVLPCSQDTDVSRVLYPAPLRKKLPDLLIQNKLTINCFAGCPDEAIDALKDQLQLFLDQKLDLFQQVQQLIQLNF